MKPTDDERREVSARLRDLAVHGNPTWPALFEALRMPGRAVAVLYLADLIEPEERTCRDEGNGRQFRCSECGCRSETWFTTPHGDSWTERPRRCPNCGARVVANE